VVNVVNVEMVSKTRLSRIAFQVFSSLDMGFLSLEISSNLTRLLPPIGDIARFHLRLQTRQKATNSTSAQPIAFLV